MGRTSKRLIITGASGPIGANLVDMCVDQGIEIVCIVRRNSHNLNRLPVSTLVTIVECNMSEYHMLADKTDGDFDALIHLAWSDTDPVGRNDINLQRRNIDATMVLLKEAKKMKCKKFIGVGSQAEYGLQSLRFNEFTHLKPTNAYGAAKASTLMLGSVLAKELKIEFNWIRIFSVYGPYQHSYTLTHHLISNLLLKQVPELTQCEQMWDMLYVKDAAKGILCVVDYGHDGEVYCLGQGVSRSLRYYVELLRDQIDVKLPLGIGKKPYNINQVMNLSVDIKKISDHTGFAPDYDYRRGINETINWYCNNEQVWR